MTWYLPNTKVRPVGLEVAEFIDTSEIELPRRTRHDEPDGDGLGATATSGWRDTDASIAQ